MIRAGHLFSFLSGVFLLQIGARAADWQIHRHEGRDYVTLNNIAEFYGFPAPAPLPVQPPPETPAPAPGSAPSAPTAATPAPATGSSPITPATTTSVAPVPPVPPLPRTVALDSGKMQLEVTLNSREVLINGAKQWLAFPSVVKDTKVLISRLDLSKVIEPRLRPERIAGLQPVTTIVLDAGHGGHDKGAISRYGYEKDFALDVALRARKVLEARGYKVAMTRTSDIFIPLHQRPKLAKHLPNAIFVSIHFNSSSTNAHARGFEIFSIAPRGAPATNDPILSPRDLREEPANAVELPSGALAGAIYHSLLGQIPTIDRGLKHARFAVLRLCTVPSVLVECGFVSNGPESALIGSPAWRQQVAEAIAEGINNYKDLAVNKTAPKLIADYRRAATTGSGVGLRDQPKSTTQ